MPINNMSVGRDLSFSISSPAPSSSTGATSTSTTSGTLTVNGVTDYEIKPMFTDLKHKDLDGSVLHAAIPDGWQISIRLDRQDSTLDDFFAALEVSYFAGQNITGATIVETIQEASGTTNQYRYNNVSLKFDSGGTWKGDSFVQLSLTGSASTRTKVA